MNISPVGKSLYGQSFKANVFYYNNKIKSDLPGYDNIDERGGKNTNIYVTDIDSDYILGEYDNLVSFNLRSPLFGNQDFIFENFHNTKYSPNENHFNRNKFLYHHFINEKNIEKYENKALKNKIVQKIRANAIKNFDNSAEKLPIDAVSVLDSILSGFNPEDEGLSEERVNSLYKLADSINNEIALKGTGAILNIKG